jgi:inosine-uridine nucleoside N-ribohydrolase
MNTGVSDQNATATAMKTTETHGTLDQETLNNLSTAMHGEAFAYVKYLLYAEHETRGEFTRGQTVANRRNEFEKNVLHHFPSGDRYVIEGLEKVEPNAKVCTDVNAEKFLEPFVSRMQGK